MFLVSFCCVSDAVHNAGRGLQPRPKRLKTSYFSWTIYSLSFYSIFKFFSLILKNDACESIKS